MYIIVFGLLWVRVIKKEDNLSPQVETIMTIFKLIIKIDYF